MYHLGLAASNGAAWTNAAAGDLLLYAAASNRRVLVGVPGTSNAAALTLSAAGATVSGQLVSGQLVSGSLLLSNATGAAGLSLSTACNNLVLTACNNLVLTACNNLVLTAGSVAAVTLTNAGLLGIGTSNPAFQLDVTGAARASGCLGVAGVLDVGAAITLSNPPNAHAGIYFYNNAGPNAGVVACPNAAGNFFSSTAQLGDLCIRSPAGGKRLLLGTGDQPAVPGITVQTSNWVGINNAAPAYQLDLTGTARINTPVAGSGGLLCSLTSDPTNPTVHLLNNNHDNIQLLFDSYYNGATVLASSNAGCARICKVSGMLGLYVTSNVPTGSNAPFQNTPSLAIPCATGYVGIATSTPAYPLDVAGTARALMSISSDANRTVATGLPQVTVRGTAGWWKLARFAAAGGGGGVISVTGTSLYIVNSETFTLNISISNQAPPSLSASVVTTGNPYGASLFAPATNADFVVVSDTAGYSHLYFTSSAVPYFVLTVSQVTLQSFRALPTDGVVPSTYFNIPYGTTTAATLNAADPTLGTIASVSSVRAALVTTVANLYGLTGIGTPTPAYTLDVSGAVRATSNIVSTAYHMSVQGASSNSSNYVGATGPALFQFQFQSSNGRYMNLSSNLNSTFVAPVTGLYSYGVSGVALGPGDKYLGNISVVRNASGNVNFSTNPNDTANVQVASVYAVSSTTTPVTSLSGTAYMASGDSLAVYAVLGGTGSAFGWYACNYSSTFTVSCIQRTA